MYVTRGETIKIVKVTRQEVYTFHLEMTKDWVTHRVHLRAYLNFDMCRI